MWFEPCPASSLPEQEQLLIIPLRWTLQGLACTTREASTVSVGAEPHCTLTWLWDHLVWSTFAAIRMSNMQVQAHPWSGNIVRAGWAPRIWLCKDGWFLTAPGRAAIVTGHPWGCICRGGRSWRCLLPLQRQNFELHSREQRVAVFIISFYGKSSIRFSWNMISRYFKKVFWFCLFAKTNKQKTTVSNTIY